MSFQNGISQLNQILTGNNIPEASSSKVQQVKDKVFVAGEANVSAHTDSDTDQANVSLAGGLVAQALQSSDIRADKVSSVQQALADGTYNVHASEVAEKLMSVMAK